mmetsp:Transcript_23439/g.59190  ORF Transcript_23439/g.59190 Transcript_23439/m.59190 type:complete len:246 (-) Transcript_23439:176-913(-)
MSAAAPRTGARQQQTRPKPLGPLRICQQSAGSGRSPSLPPRPRQPSRALRHRRRQRRHLPQRLRRPQRRQRSTGTRGTHRSRRWSTAVAGRDPAVPRCRPTPPLRSPPPPQRPKTAPKTPPAARAAAAAAAAVAGASEGGRGQWTARTSAGHCKRLAAAKLKGCGRGSGQRGGRCSGSVHPGATAPGDAALASCAFACIYAAPRLHLGIARFSCPPACAAEAFAQCMSAWHSSLRGPPHALAAGE